MSEWIYVVIFLALLFYGWFCYRIGKTDTQERFIEAQKKIDQARLWMEMMKKGMGGKDE